VLHQVECMRTPVSACDASPTGCTGGQTTGVDANAAILESDSMAKAKFLHAIDVRHPTGLQKFPTCA
ncbi:hypothetical protein, partial [Xanthomonas vasicola]|uniref:hypothetical protein n=1 Tax=Xanthomonas vasicola TaxID=56459 RepID=UPI001C100CC4